MAQTQARPDVAYDDDETRIVGQVGLIGVLITAVILAIHPFGSSDLYDDGEQFLDHVGAYWLTIHFIVAIGLLVVPLIVDRWAGTLSAPLARVIGRWAALVAIGGVSMAALHLIGTDTMSFVAFRDTFEAGEGSEATLVGADLLLRLHASTLAAWVAVFFLAVPLLAGLAGWIEGRGPRWVPALAIGAGVLELVALIITFNQRQWTTLSEQVVFRTGATLYIVWLLATCVALRRGAPIGEPAPA